MVENLTLTDRVWRDREGRMSKVIPWVAVRKPAHFCLSPLCHCLAYMRTSTEPKNVATFSIRILILQAIRKLELCTWPN